MALGHCQNYTGFQFIDNFQFVYHVKNKGLKKHKYSEYYCGQQGHFQTLILLACDPHATCCSTQHLQNTTGGLDDLWSTLRKRNTWWEDVDAVSTALPNLRVTLRFCTFMVSNFTSFENNKGVLLLKRMAAGIDPVPDLLVTGYSSWTLSIMDWGSTIPYLSVMDRAREGVSRLASLFHRLSLRTRVLVLSESRVKPFARHFHPWRFYVFSDSNVEWVEKMFFHYLQQVEETQIRERRSPSGSRPESDWLKADSEGLWWWDSSLPHGLAVRALCAELHAENLTLMPQYGRLRCNDTNHAGETTLQVRATMLLNLVCNAAVTLQADNVCCQ
ncbi:uncharacterized protein LOC134771380 [Penaeus indicus]|uniref:uncharacterized protein LOC134771380 n=1 Tax=Penaeus indicus TaxID=29960 RepID=UPI00300D7451